MAERHHKGDTARDIRVTAWDGWVSSFKVLFWIIDTFAGLILHGMECSSFRQMWSRGILHESEGNISV